MRGFQQPELFVIDMNFAMMPFNWLSCLFCSVYTRSCYDASESIWSRFYLRFRLSSMSEMWSCCWKYFTRFLPIANFTKQLFLEEPSRITGTQRMWAWSSTLRSGIASQGDAGGVLLQTGLRLCRMVISWWQFQYLAYGAPEIFSPLPRTITGTWSKKKSSFLLSTSTVLHDSLTGILTPVYSVIVGNTYVSRPILRCLARLI